jgi:hypothetical protein
MPASTVPEFLTALVDDAAVFPPGNAPLDQAVRDHEAHRAAPYGDLVGPLVVADSHLPQLLELLDATAQPRPLPVAVVISGGAGAVEPAVRWATGDGAVDLRAVEIAMRESDAGDLAPNADRIVAAFDSLVAAGLLDDEVEVYVEPPRWSGPQPSASWLRALDSLAAVDHRLKLRTGGPSPDSVPPSPELAGSISAALDRELRFKCTAGLHHAVRHHDAGTGQDRHGFLNVLLATRTALDGGTPQDVAAVLERADESGLAASADPVAMASARRWFTSFGSCSVEEPVEDLTRLGLLP